MASCHSEHRNFSNDNQIFVHRKTSYVYGSLYYLASLLSKLISEDQRSTYVTIVSCLAYVEKSSLKNFGILKPSSEIDFS